MAQSRVLRTISISVVIALLSVVVIARYGGNALADAPHTGLNFSIGVDADGNGTNDCGSGVPLAVGDGAPDVVPVQVSNTACTAVLGNTVTVNVYLMSNGGVAYAGELSFVYYTGITSPAPATGTSVWTGCVSALTAPPNPAYEVAACFNGVLSVTNLGLMTKFVFTCTASGTIRLGHAQGETTLTDGGDHREAGPDSLTITCRQPSVGGVSLDVDPNGSARNGWPEPLDLAVVLLVGAGAGGALTLTVLRRRAVRR